MGSAEPELPAAVVDLLHGRPPTLSGARLLCVDGPAGSGKTTLAGAVARLLAARGCAVAVLAMDDLYDGWTGLDEELEERVLRQVLRPLATGRAARWQRYDWDRGEFGPWEVTELPDVVVLEGCGAGARRFAPYATVLAWVEAPAAERLRRMVARDGDGVRRHLAGWTDLEARAFAANATRERADLRLLTGAQVRLRH